MGQPLNYSLGLGGRELEVLATGWKGKGTHLLSGGLGLSGPHRWLKQM